MNIKIGGYVWLLKSELSSSNVENMCNALTVFPRNTSDMKSRDPSPIRLYVDQGDVFGVPWGFFKKHVKDGSGHVFEQELSDGFDMMPFKSSLTFEGPYREQAVAIDHILDCMKLDKWGGYIIQGGTGFGKSNTALGLAEKLRKSTLIVVHKEFLMRQWADRITGNSERNIKGLFPDARVGFIQEDRCEYGPDYDFTIAMIHSLAKEDGTRYPAEMYNSFGLVMSDETHRVAAKTWAPVMPMFSARWRIGLSATLRRKDGAEDVFFQHIGEIEYVAKTKMLVPVVRRMFSETELHSERIKGKNGYFTVKPDKLRSVYAVKQICDDDFRTGYVCDDALKAVYSSTMRKVMIISDRLDHLRKMRDYLYRRIEQSGAGKYMKSAPTVDFYTGDWYTGELIEKKEPVLDESMNPIKERVGKSLRIKKQVVKDKDGNPVMIEKTKRRSEAELLKAERANIILATKHMVSEGLDIPSLDTIVLGVPFSDVEQMIGRGVRRCLPDEGKCEHFCPWRSGVCQKKPDPMVADMVDERIPWAVRKWKYRKRFYRKIGAL